MRDARFDLDHCRIVAPFTGRIGRHQVSVGNLIAGSRYATSPTTLLTTIVSLDPIYLDFDMSESDYEAFQRYRGKVSGLPADRVELASGGSTTYDRQGTLDFVDNVLDRSSGTIHGAQCRRPFHARRVLARAGGCHASGAHPDGA
ncbi:MAG: hypothetical protein VB131_03430 [Burkholderia gladioli]